MARHKKPARERAAHRLYMQNRRAAGIGDKDYAFMMHRSISKVITENGGDASKVSIDVLRAIMLLQTECDGLDGSHFTLPSSAHVQIYKSWNKWRKRLSAESRAQVPVLVRMDSHVGWVIGNLFFISELWADAYRKAGGLKEFMSLISKICDGNGAIVPSQVDVEQLVNAMRAERSMLEAQEKGAVDGQT